MSASASVESSDSSAPELIYTSHLPGTAPAFAEALAALRTYLFDATLFNCKAYTALHDYKECESAAMDERKANGTWIGVHKHLDAMLGWDEYEDSEDNAPRTASGWGRQWGSLVHTELSTLATQIDLRNAAELVQPLTRWLVRYLAHRDWIACGADVPIWSFDNCSTCTEADLVVLDRAAERLIVIELKTGYEDDVAYEKRPDARPIDPAGFPNNARWRHQHQLAWMVHHLRKRLPANVRVDGCVLRASHARGVLAPEWLDERLLGHYERTYAVAASEK